MTPSPATFIAIEGTDEAGKSTLVKTLAPLLEARGFVVVTTRVPGGTPFAEELRTLLFSEAGARMTLQAQMQLVHTGQIDHVRNKIAPALREGKIVISDRYELSSYVYEVAKQPDLEDEFLTMKSELDEILGEFRPVYLLLDLPAEEILKRVQSSDKLTHFDVHSLDEIEARRQVYLESIKRLGNTYYVLDATLTPSEIAQIAIEKLGL